MCVHLPVAVCVLSRAPWNGAALLPFFRAAAGLAHLPALTPTLITIVQRQQQAEYICHTIDQPTLHGHVHTRYTLAQCARGYTHTHTHSTNRPMHTHPVQDHQKHTRLMHTIFAGASC